MGFSGFFPGDSAFRGNGARNGDSPVSLAERHLHGKASRRCVDSLAWYSPHFLVRHDIAPTSTRNSTVLHNIDTE